MRLSGPRSRPTVTQSGPCSRPITSQKILQHRESNPDLWICSQELWPLDHRGGRSDCTARVFRRDSPGKAAQRLARSIRESWGVLWLVIRLLSERADVPTSVIKALRTPVLHSSPHLSAGWSSPLPLPVLLLLRVGGLSRLNTRAIRRRKKFKWFWKKARVWTGVCLSVIVNGSAALCWARQIFQFLNSIHSR
jgi:hypothetical protein